MLEQLKLADEEDKVLYTSMYIRRQVIAHFVASYDEFENRVKIFIRNEYGRIDSQEGPFNAKTWCEYILTDKSYCDGMFIQLLASLFAVRITVVRSDTLAEIKFRHDKALDDAELVFMFNCSPLGGHYTPCIKTGEGNLEFLLLECQTVAISRLYKKDEDLIECTERRDSV